MEGNSGAHTINEKTVRFSMRCLKMADGSCAPAGCRQPRRVRPMVPGHHPHDGPGDQRGVNRMRFWRLGGVSEAATGEGNATERISRVGRIVRTDDWKMTYHPGKQSRRLKIWTWGHCLTKRPLVWVRSCSDRIPGAMLGERQKVGGRWKCHKATKGLRRPLLAARRKPMIDKRIRTRLLSAKPQA